MLQASGRLLVTPGSVRINIHNDFCRYYRKFILEYYGETVQEFHPPMHGAHITIIAKKIHPGVDTPVLMDYDGDVIPFTYDHVILKGGTKFTTYYAYVECPFAEFVKRKVGVVDPETFLGLHICICNNKQSKYYDWK